MKLFELDNASIEEVETDEVRVGKGAKSTTFVHPGKTKLHMRRAIKNAGSPGAKEVNWLCAAHNGTYVYVYDNGDEVTVVVTDKDMQP